MILALLPKVGAGQDCETAGTNGSIAVCSTSGSVQLMNALGGSPDPGGSWSGPDGPHSGIFSPGDPGGTYTYTVVGTPPCANASATVEVSLNEQPDAGTNGSITVCGNDPAFNLFSALNGSPDPGGAWTGPAGSAVSATYTPGTSTPGTYTYTLLGQPPCTTATASVAVTQITPPNAGVNTNITICSDDPPFQLITQLNGSPAAGGTWVGPNGPQGATFDPAVHPGGTYTYTVPGTAPCANASAVLNIIKRIAPDAGTNASITVCSNDGSFSLFDLLGGDPQMGGTWTGTTGQPHSGTFQPGTSPAGVYTYTVVGQAPCPADVSTISVTVSTAPVAGNGGSVVRCSNAPAFSMFAQLGGSPNPGGTWTGPEGPHAVTFTPGTDTPGAYTYTVNGPAGCDDATAVLNVSIVNAPIAGSNGDTLICSNAGQFPLINILNGSPALNGTWTAPGGGGSTGNFIPGTSTPGVYTYTVIGQAPCANATATATVTVQAMPNAGTNGSITVCSTAGAINLFQQLGGSPASGGSWTGPSGAAHNGTYQPASQPGGIYTYTVQGTAPCAAASATVQVIRVIAPRAGTDGTITICSTNSPFQMLNVLGGAPDGNGTWRNSANTTVPGTFTPGTTPPGTYAYIVTGTAPCANDTSYVTINMNQAPDAGVGSSIDVCSSDASFNLLAQLGGTPDPGGNWIGPNSAAHNGTFIPGTSLEGSYTYTVPGQTPCLNASAVIFVDQNAQPVAGTNASFTRCSTDPPVDLLSILGGTPDPGGSWSGPSTLSNGIFIPGSHTPGVYTYTVTGLVPCENAVAQVTAVVNTAPDAGTDGTITVCQGDQEIDLRTGLGNDPDLNGTWNDDDGTGQLSGHILSTMGLGVGNYSFTYTVPGIGQCASDAAVVEVTIVANLNAGTNGLINVCRTNTQVDLFDALNGSPQPGGIWTDQNGTGAQTGQYFNASFVPAGTYSFLYELNGTVSCASASASVTVNVTQAPNAGLNGQAVLCSNGNSVQLFSYLGGSPSAGGTWTRNGSTVSSTYNPTVHQPGTYIYTVSGTGPCANAQASVIVSEVAAPIAGTGGPLSVCCSDPAFNMTQLLTGSPQVGSWSYQGAPHGSDFVPCLDEAGVYVYTVPGQVPCNAATASLTISVVQPPEAGTNGSMVLCSSGSPLVLLSQMNGADFGGTWIAPDNTTHTSNFVYQPGNTAPGEFIYQVSGSGPCDADAASLLIFENDAANAGGDVAVTFCSDGPSVDLFTLLPGAPDPSGTWTGPGGSASDGFFVPGTSTAGTYIYVVEGAPPCITDSASVTVSIEQAPDAGGSNVSVVCSDDQAFSMVQMLSGSPELGGTWYGPLPATTPHDGIFFPATSSPGEYVYTVEGGQACDPDTAILEVIVNPAPNAGNNADLSLCSTSGSVNLFTLLGPNAQPGGTWTIQSSGASFSGTFSPAVHSSGVYVYTRTGQPPCDNDVALVSVTLNQAPNAGFNGLVTICDNAGPFNLRDHLNGTPQLNGNWTGPNGSHSGIFIPGSDVGGVYTYTVNGAAPCQNATAQVTVIQNIQPDAGQNGVVQICSDQAPFQLFDHLSGTPDPGGNWLTPNSTSFSGTFIPGTSQPGAYTYILPAQAPCVSDSARVTVIQSIAPNAGCNAVSQICSSSSLVPLIDLLGCSPAGNGSWTFGVNGPAHGPNFDPSVDVSGTYVYTVTGTSPCTNAAAQVQITKVNAPNAGNNGSVAACLDDSSISLFNALGGSPSSGGTWANLNSAGTITNGVLNATGVAAGSYQYRYIVGGTGPCPNDTSFVTVQISTALDAGNDASVEVCETELLDLFSTLGGTPQQGGSWVDVNGSGALIGNVFNAAEVTAGSTWIFDYILPSSSLCEGDTARVTVTVVEGPNAGCSGQVSVCSTGAPVQLANSLGCSPDADGIWYTPANTVHSGSFDPTEDAAGIYIYVVPEVGSCSADSTTITVTIQQASNAGEDAQLSICSTDTPVLLFDLLGPTAQTGGSWFYVTGNIAHTGLYNPATNAPGTYRYTVQAQAPCANDFAFVEVSEPAAPNAGCNASVNICSSVTPIALLDHLGCSPAEGGTWFAPDGTEHGDFFDPGSDEPGEYEYVLIGTAPCNDASATLVVAVTAANNPGTSTAVDACISQSSLDLFEALGPLADAGGSWADLDSSNALAGGILDPSLAGIGQWMFQYSFPSNGPCPATNSTVTVNITAGANAGVDSSVTVCGADPQVELFPALGGNPDQGGTWEDLTGTGSLEGSSFNAQMLEPGSVVQFGYQIVDPGCGPVSAVVTATISNYLDPGFSDTVGVCIISDPVQLFSALGGTPDPGGIWTGPNAAEHSGTFTPGIDQPGTYFYNMPPTPECGALSSFVLVELVQLANAGDDASLIACDTISALDLFTGLAGEPQTGGAWEDLTGVGSALSNGILNVQDLENGNYDFRYLIDVGECGTDEAVLTVQVIEGPQVGEVVRSCDEQSRTYVITFPISSGDPSSYEVIGVPGSISTGPSYIFTSDPIPTNQAFDAYVSDGSGCGSIQVTGVSPCSFDDELFIPGSFSPNDDGINDVFVIPGIQGYPENTVVIFNRWGSKIFEASGYDNSLVVWDGSSTSALIPGKVPAGTYFYVIDIGTEKEPFTGYIYLNR